MSEQCFFYGNRTQIQVFIVQWRHLSLYPLFMAGSGKCTGTSIITSHSPHKSARVEGIKPSHLRRWPQEYRAKTCPAGMESKDC